MLLLAEDNLGGSFWHILFPSLFPPILSWNYFDLNVLGIDEQRARLIAALLMSTGAALIGAAGGRRKLGAILGAGIVFCIGYLVGFIQHELQPTYDPLGNVELLNGGALVHTAFVMIALALLGAFA